MGTFSVDDDNLEKIQATNLWSNLMKTTVQILLFRRYWTANTKNIHYRIKNYSATLLVGRMTSPNKARKYKICIIVFLTSYYTTMLSFSRTWFLSSTFYEIIQDGHTCKIRTICQRSIQLASVVTSKRWIHLRLN